MSSGNATVGVPAGNSGSTLLSDLKAGFMVFLIALPLCLGIAAASKCPPVAGIYTAIAGGILTTFLSNSQLTIKGPAAGLIVIISGGVLAFRDNVTAQLYPDESVAMFEAYRMALAVCVVSGIIQIIFGAVKGGILGDFFPSSAVHGMLASIGIIIIAKQLPVAFGIGGAALWEPGTTHEYEKPLYLIMHLPWIIWQHTNPQYAAIGVVALLIMFGMPALSPKISKSLPAQLVVLLVTVPLAIFVLGVPHPALTIFGTELMPAKVDAMPAAAPVAPPQTAADKEAAKSDAAKTEAANTPGVAEEGKKTETPVVAKAPPQYKPLVAVPPVKPGDKDVLGEQKDRVMDMFQGILLPNFEGLKYPFAWIWVALFSIIGSLESLLSAKAVDMLDPLKRKTDLNRDLLAVGVANTAVAFFGGIPMIAEIVRSRANIDNGAKSRMADFYHGVFLLIAVITIPMLLNLIPMASLAAMLIFTGFRLAHPREFMHVYHLGREQLVVFVATILGVLATDLLQGIFIGIGVKLLIHYINGVPLISLFKPFLTIEQHDKDTYLIKVAKSAVFSNWLLFRKQIYAYGYLQDKNLILDFSDTVLVDHTVMEKLNEAQRDFQSKGLRLEVRGLEHHISVSGHPTSARIRGRAEQLAH